MKVSVKRSLAIIALAAVIGFLMTGCDNGGGNGNGDKGASGGLGNSDSGNKTYTVKYNGNTNTGGAVPIDDNSPYQSGATVTVMGNTNDLKKTGYTFTGWNTAANGSGSSYWIGGTFSINSNTTLYAEWTEGYYVTTRSITFYSNGGSEVKSITGIPNGKTIQKPTDPTSGYGTFENWYKDSDRTIPFDFSAPITASVSLYAKWNAAYEIGDTGPGGGKIIYRVETSFKLYTGTTMDDENYIKAYYLEAAPENMAEKLRWSTLTDAPYVDIGGTYEAVGRGKKNTALILASDATAPAALACDEYENNGKKDWFLPSNSELSYLYFNKSLFDNLENGGGYGGGQYWSSYTFTNLYAYGYDFWTGTYKGYEKNGSHHVRAIRAF